MTRTSRFAALTVALLLFTAACGDDDDSADPGDDTAADAEGGDDAAAEGLARAQEIVDANSEAPTEIGPTIPLDGAPDKKTVAWLECELPSCTQITPGFEAATEALGWDLEVISVESFDPAPGFQQAIDAGVDYVAITGTPAALIQTQIDAANEAGIKFFSCFSTEDVDPEANIHQQCGDESAVEKTGGLLANWTIADSGGEAHTLMVNIPDYPVLVAEQEAAAAQYEENCPNCTFDTLDTTLEALTAGEVPGAVASALQSDPSINYVHFSFSDIPAGVADTLESSGQLEDVKLTGVDFNATIGLTEIVDGRHAAWTANPKEYTGWLMIDAMARDALGMDNTEERDVAALPTFVVDDAETAEALIPSDGWRGPEGMEDQFKALWGVD